MATQSTPIVDDASLASIATADVTVDTDAAATSDVDSQVDQTTSADPGAGDATVDTDATQTGDQQDTSADTQDGRKLPAHIRELKESNPELFKREKARFFEHQEYKSVYPTVQAAREEHQLVASLGGAKGIATLREDAGVFKTAAQQFVKGDPAFVKDLFDEDPIAAALHVQPMLDQFKERDFDGYKQLTAQMWDKEFQSTGFVKAIQKIGELIAASDKDNALAWLNSFKNWQESISNIARQGPSAREKALLAERAKQHETREQSEKSEFNKSYRTETTNETVDEAGKVFDSFFRGRKISDDDRTDLLNDALKLASREIIKGVPGEEFVKQRDAHLAAGDSASAKRLVVARYKQFMPDAVKRIARRYGMMSGAPAGAPKPAPTSTGQAASKPGATVQGFVRVNEYPKGDDIDRGKSTREMLQAGRAVLKSGRKIDYAHLRKSA